MIEKLQENRVFRTYLGGKHIDEFYGRDSGEDSYFPEDWTASLVKAYNPGREAIVEGYGHLADGREVRGLQGISLRCLVKLLDSAERLVIQVHPTKEFAKEYFASDYGKTECWYFLDCDEDACIYLGFKKGVAPKKWREVFDRQDIPEMLDMLHRIPVKKGDCVFVDGGLPHAIGKGCFMIEIQEPSDLMGVTERRTPSGREIADAKIHGGIGVDNMMKMFHYSGSEAPDVLDNHFQKARMCDRGVRCLVDGERTDKFSLYELSEGADFCPEIKTGILIITEGEGILNGVFVKRGDRLLYCDEARLQLSSETHCKAVLCF